MGENHEMYINALGKIIRHLMFVKSGRVLASPVVQYYNIKYGKLTHQDDITV